MPGTAYVGPPPVSVRSSRSPIPAYQAWPWCECHFTRFRKDWLQTKEEVCRIIGNTPASIDSTGVGDPIVEDITRVCQKAEGFKFGSVSKQQIMEGLASSIQNRNTTVLEGEHRDEMESFEFMYSKRGVKYSAPEGLHDDIVCAHALAVHKFAAITKTGWYVVR